MKTVNKRHLFIGAMAVLLVLLRVFAPSDDGPGPNGAAAAGHAVRKYGASPAAARASAAMPLAGSEALPDALSVQERDVVHDVPDLFQPVSWYIAPPVPKPAVIAPLPAPVPTAPPLPFQFLGKYIEGSRELIILSRANRVLTVSQGDVIAETYRVDGFTDTDIRFTYLPMNIPQTLSTETSKSLR